APAKPQRSPAEPHSSLPCRFARAPWTRHTRACRSRLPMRARPPWLYRVRQPHGLEQKDGRRRSPSPPTPPGGLCRTCPPHPSGEHHVVPVHGLLSRPRENLLDRTRLQAHDATELLGRVVADALAQEHASATIVRPSAFLPCGCALGDLDGVPSIEGAEHLDDSHRQQ